VITAVDTNILIDILEPDPIHGLRSKETLMSMEAALGAARSWHNYRRRGGGRDRIAADFLADARDPARRAAFAAAQGVSHHGTLDDYIDFLSENMGIAGESAPRIMKTAGYRL
jgi:hypothetical protein